MLENEIIVLTGAEVESMFREREEELMNLVGEAYLAYAAGSSSLPHSSFLRFPGNEKNRIIALPAYLAEDFQMAGIKWIASFPENHAKGMDRASAVIILNSTETGRPLAILEGSIISAKRTAASAALAARTLHAGRPGSVMAVVGCGFINREIVRFMVKAWPGLRSIKVYDKHPERAELFVDKCKDTPGLEFSIENTLEKALVNADFISLATTASVPHISDLPASPPGCTILNVSLRDLAPSLILESDNVVDDANHVCRAETSLHLAEKASGGREFIRSSLADILSGKAEPRDAKGRRCIFSPFGLGILDLALAGEAYSISRRKNSGVLVPSFLPRYWTART